MRVSTGKLHGAICGFGGELHLSGDFCIIHQQWLIRGLVHEYARNGIGLARGQAGVLHHIHNGDFAGGFSGVLAIHGSRGANAGLLGENDGLSLVLDVLMAGNLGFALEERLKHDNCFSCQRRSVKGKQHVNGPAGLSRGERGLGCDLGMFLTLANQQGFAGFLIHQNAGQLVLLAYGQTAVFHSIRDGDLFGRNSGLFAINGGGCADGGLAKGNGLAFIGDVRMRGDNVLIQVKVLKDHHGLASQCGCVKGVGQFHRALGAGGGELQLCCDRLLVDQQGLTGFFVHQDTGKFVGLAHFEIFVGDRVHQGDLPGRFRRVFSIHRGSSANLGDALKLVVDGAQIDGGVVAGDGDLPHTPGAG